MEVRDAHRVHRPLLVHLGDEGAVRERVVRIAPGLGVVEVEHRLGDAEEQQPDADTGGEQHGEPGEVAELGLAVVVAELD